MKVYALLSWYDEDPEHLDDCVRSLAGLADCVVALDGAYATFPGATATSPVEQGRAIGKAAWDVGIGCSLRVPAEPWQGGEVEKRAAMFDLARRVGATPNDWFLIIDGDMIVAESSGAREALEATDMDVAEVRWHDIGPGDGLPFSTTKFRSMFRAIPGLTVEHTHYLYVQHPQCARQSDWCDGERCVDKGIDCQYAGQDGRRFLWHTPDGHPSNEPCLDLSEHVTLHHRRQFRDPERNARAGVYYVNRDAAGLEVAQ